MDNISIGRSTPRIGENGKDKGMLDMSTAQAEKYGIEHGLPRLQPLKTLGAEHFVTRVDVDHFLGPYGSSDFIHELSDEELVRLYDKLLDAKAYLLQAERDMREELRLRGHKRVADGDRWI